jgi:hypothetical protein
MHSQTPRWRLAHVGGHLRAGKRQLDDQLKNKPQDHQQEDQRKLITARRSAARARGQFRRPVGRCLGIFFFSHGRVVFGLSFRISDSEKMQLKSARLKQFFARCCQSVQPALGAGRLKLLLF